MFDTLLNGSALNCIYAAALLIGFLYALFLLFFQGVSHAFDISDFELFGHHIDFGDLFDLSGHDIDVSSDHDFDTGHDGHEASGLSMLAISGFITAFGAIGLASTTLFKAGTAVSLLAAVAAGVLIGGAAQIFFIQVLSPTTSNNIHLSTLKGTSARVTVPVPPSGRGQITFVIAGQRHTLGAESSAGLPIGRDTPVIIDSLRDGVAFISTQPEE